MRLVVLPTWLLLAATVFSTHACPSGSYDVAVVGAGIAGLATAATLPDSLNVVLLESSEHIGGRMRTVDLSTHGFATSSKSFDGWIEAGANWINGGLGNNDKNPLLALAQDSHIDTYKMDLFDLVVRSSDGGPHLRFSTVRQKMRAFEKALRCLLDFGDVLYQGFPNADQAALDDSMLNILRDVCGWEPSDLVDDVLVRYYFGAEYLLPDEDLSSFNFGEDLYFDFGNADNFVKDQDGGNYGTPGMQGLAVDYYYANGLDAITHLQTKVTQIAYGPAGATLSIDGCPDIFASKVAFSGSVGVIEAGADTLFNPPIDLSSFPLRMGTWTKVFYQFDATFWDADGQFVLVGDPDRHERSKDFCSVWLNYDYAGPGQRTLFPGSHMIARLVEQHVLETFAEKQLGVADATGFAMDASNSFQTDALLEPLLRAYDMSSPPSYQAYATDWGSDENFRGSWENWQLMDPPLGIVEYFDFWKPREDTLWLTGSGSCWRYWGFITGGYLGGIKTAEWIVNSLNEVRDEAGMALEPSSTCDEFGVV